MGESDNKRKILVVEDEMAIAQAEKIILEGDYEVHLAYDGEEGLRKIKELKPELVVLDIMMPKLSGFEVCKALRADPAVASTKVVMVTAKNQDKDELEGMELGADDYIMKPFEPTELLHVIRQILKE